MIKYKKNSNLSYRLLNPAVYLELINSTEWFRQGYVPPTAEILVQKKEHRRIIKKGPKRF